MTTITVDDEVRRRLKRLSVLLDMSQGEIVKLSLELFERLVLSPEERVLLPRRVIELLDEVSKRVRDSDPEWARRSKVIEGAVSGPEEALWGREL